MRQVFSRFIADFVGGPRFLCASIRSPPMARRAGRRGTSRRGTSGTANEQRHGRGPSAFFQEDHPSSSCPPERHATLLPRTPDARSRALPVRETAGPEAGNRGRTRRRVVRPPCHARRWQQTLGRSRRRPAPGVHGGKGAFRRNRDTHRSAGLRRHDGRRCRRRAATKSAMNLEKTCLTRGQRRKR